MSGISWEQPPAGRDKPITRTAWGPIVAELRTRPGEWAVVAVKPTAAAAATVAAHMRRGIYTGMSRGEFEAMARTVDGEYRVYARYVGTGDGDA